MGKLFVSIYNYFEKHKVLFYTLVVLVFSVSAFFAFRIQLEEDISKALPKDKKIEKLNEVFQNSKLLDKLAVSVSLKDTSSVPQPDSLIAYADELVEIVNTRLGRYVRKVNYKVDDEVMLSMLSTITAHLPVYLEESDYRSIDSLIMPGKVRETLEQDFRTLSSPTGIVMKSLLRKDPVGLSGPALKKLRGLQVDENFEMIDNCIFTKDHKNLLVFITPAFPPANTGENAKFLSGLDSAIAVLSTQRQDRVGAEYFGATAVSAGNAIQLRKDSMFTQGITVVFLVLFIGLYFRRKRAPLVVLIPVAFGAVFSLALLYFIKGKISVIALGTGSVVFGIAVNYSLHFFNHYRHRNDIREVIRDLSMPLTIGSFTTIGGFLSLQFVKSEMLKDLGLFTAFSLVGASLCSLILLPHIVQSKRRHEAFQQPRHTWLDKISAYGLEHNRLFVFLIFILTVVFAYTSQNVSFESDMMKMNYMPEALRKAEADMNRINSMALQSVYLVSEGRTLDEALANNEKVLGRVDSLKAEGAVKKFSGVSSLLISDSLQRVRIDRWNAYWTTDKKVNLLKAVKENAAALKFSPAAFDDFTTLLTTDFQPVKPEEMSAVRAAFLDDFLTEKPGHCTVVDIIKVSPGRSGEVYAAFENNEGVTLVDKQYLTRKFVEIINSDFTSIALMTSLLVFVVLLLTYGRIELALVSFIPMFITWIWILGIMALFGIQFNIINIILSALIFGLGDDYSLFIMDGLLQEYKTGKENLASYKSSILLSAITTVVGLGVLIFAKHPALKSIALISIIGMICVVLISLILIPFFFNLLITKRTRKSLYPWTLWSFLKSLFAFCYFLFGSVLLTLLGVIFTKLWPFGKKRGKLIYHSIMSFFTWSLMYIMANVKKQIINPHSERFDKPAVIICNHQSFLDILSTVMLRPKIVLLTNHWVWNSPVFGAAVRMADYYPVMEGAEPGIERLADRVKEGYSIVVFPEGTRSVDGVIKRFHKGAFYLAEKLNIDILPLLIHGTGYTMTKNDFLLKDGVITLKYLPRISPADATYGATYSERAKLVGRYFRSEYAKLKEQVEQPSYHWEKLFYTYVYKGPVLEWYMRFKVRMEKYYQLFHDLLPREGDILDIGCGYGFMSYMLHFSAPGRRITGIDYDEEKTALAAHSFTASPAIQFHHADVNTFRFEKYDGIVIADVLHYLRPEEQRQIIVSSIISLRPGGVLIIRDGNAELEQRHKGTRLTEFFSTKVFSFNKTTTEGLSFLSGSTIRDIAAEHRMICTEIDTTRHTSNIIFVLRKPEERERAGA